MRKRTFALIVLCIMLGLPVLGGLAGYRAAYQRMHKKPWQVNDAVRRQVEALRQAETLAGAMSLQSLPLDGLERCYFTSNLDFNRITWIGPDVPTPFVGYAPAPGKMASGHINAMQFRYEDELQLPKPKGVCRIFLVGGSTAYGAGATSNAATIGGCLERLLNEESAGGRRFEVVTAAAGAWASTHERILIENRLIELAPDFVISLSGFNDVHWSLMNRNVLWFRTYQDEYYRMLADSLLSCNFERGLARTRPGEEAAVGPALAARRLHWNVTRARQALAEVGAVYCFALQPVQACSRKGRTPREALMAERMAVRTPEEAVAEHYAEFRRVLTPISTGGFAFFDLAAVFDEGYDEADVFIDGCHFGDRGNELIARELATRLREVLPRP